MKLRMVLFSTACLSYFMVPVAGINLLAAAAASSDVVIESLAGVSAGQQVVFHVKPPPQHVVLEHKPVTLVPVATIPSYSITDKIAKLWSSVSDSIGTKIQAVGDFFRGPPKVVLLNVNTATQKPITTKKPHLPVIATVIGVPHHRVYPLQVPVVVDDCLNKIQCY